MAFWFLVSAPALSLSFSLSQSIARHWPKLIYEIHTHTNDSVRRHKIILSSSKLGVLIKLNNLPTFTPCLHQTCCLHTSP